MTPTPFQQAYETYHSQLRRLLAEGHYGRWALAYADRLEINESRDRLYQIARENGWPEEDILVDLIAPEPEDIEEETFNHR